MMRATGSGVGTTLEREEHVEEGAMKEQRRRSEEEVNWSQLKFLDGTWSISRIDPTLLSSNSAKTAQL
jgi:hypothetical protein